VVTDRAVRQWIEAGRHAAARSAHLEAIGHLDRGLAVTRSMPEGTERIEQQSIEGDLEKRKQLVWKLGYWRRTSLAPSSFTIGAPPAGGLM
jgi:hypothetical protein